jgi:hypothetical protein
MKELTPKQKRQIAEIRKKFRKSVQHTLDKDGRIDKITLQIGNEEPIVIAEKKKNANP